MPECIYCGAQIAQENEFCGKCGKKQVYKYTQTFRRDNMTEQQFIASVNAWFAQYPKVANVKAKFLTRNEFGMFVNRYALDAISIEYELFKNDNENQYAVVYLEKSGLTKTTTDELLNNWKRANPNAKIVARDGGTHMRGKTGSLLIGGVGARNKAQLYVLFKFNRETGTGPA